tara:strand:- start:335 stop:1756 length:1422 start_codon:yes stop_codon:yes gene_type:complete
MVELRNYQEQYILELQNSFKRNNKRVILCSPTGSGKTVMFSWMVKKATEINKRILILTDRKELFQQSGGALQKIGLNPEYINPDFKGKLNGQLYVAMMQTISRRLKKPEYLEYISSLDLIIIDEAHKEIFNPLLDIVSDKTFVIGATATPHREGKQRSLEIDYTDIVQVIDTPKLCELEYLSTCSSYGVKIDLSGIKTKGGDYDEKSMAEKFSEIKLFHGVYNNYMRIAPNKKALIFSPNVDSSKELVEDWCKMGLDAKHVDCYMSNIERKSILEWFDKTPGAILSNYGILTTGYDCPSIEVVILYRATKSLPLFLQMVGRGSRVTKSKQDFILLDFGNNVKKHNYWEHPRFWTLAKKEKKEGEIPMRECPNCSYLMHSRIPECPECGYEFEPTEKEIEERFEVELMLMSNAKLISEVSMADFDKLLIIAKLKNYKDGWILHNLKTNKDYKAYGKYKGYHWKWAERQINLLRL